MVVIGHVQVALPFGVSVLFSCLCGVVVSGKTSYLYHWHIGYSWRSRGSWGWSKHVVLSDRHLAPTTIPAMVDVAPGTGATGQKCTARELVHIFPALVL